MKIIYYFNYVLIGIASYLKILDLSLTYFAIGSQIGTESHPFYKNSLIYNIPLMCIIIFGICLLLILLNYSFLKFAKESIFLGVSISLGLIIFIVISLIGVIHNYNLVY